MGRGLFGDLVVSGNGAARSPSLKTLPLSLAVHAVAVALLAMLSISAVSEMPVRTSPVIFPPSARPGAPRAIPTVRSSSRAPRPGQRPLVTVDAVPVVVPDAAPPDVDIGILDAPPGDSPLCLGCAPADSGGGDAPGTTGPGGSGDGSGDGAAPIRMVGGDIQEPRRIRGAAPVYPDLARRAHVEGKVVLECVIDTDGRVTDLRVVSGHPMLAQAALEAVRGWVYIPTRLNGQPVRVILTVTVKFGLERS